MSTIMTQSRLFQSAVQYIAEKRQEADKPLAILLDEAAMRFNLSPHESQCLEKVFTSKDDE